MDIDFSKLIFSNFFLIFSKVEDFFFLKAKLIGQINWRIFEPKELSIGELIFRNKGIGE